MRAFGLLLRWQFLRWRHELVFIVGDEDDWPKDLYVRMGFRPIGRTWTCLREAVSAGGAPAPR